MKNSNSSSSFKRSLALRITLSLLGLPGMAEIAYRIGRKDTEENIYSSAEEAVKPKTAEPPKEDGQE